jgi:hypothetical protein
VDNVLDRAYLGELSTSFADRLFLEFSGWEERAELLVDAQGLPTGAFCVSIPQLLGDRTLDVRTDEGEITVGFGFWHAHYGSYLGISDQEAIAQALEVIHGILEEQSVVRVAFAGGAWAASSLRDASEPLPLPQPGETAVAYSWCGTHDRNL